MLHVEKINIFLSIFFSQYNYINILKRILLEVQNEEEVYLSDF